APKRPDICDRSISGNFGTGGGDLMYMVMVIHQIFAIALSTYTVRIHAMSGAVIVSVVASYRRLGASLAGFVGLRQISTTT
ncbi:hypothetical protein LD891_16955, partial [Salmonella enterica]|nr:hypothetical protein [Salmonella enterica]